MPLGGVCYSGLVLNAIAHSLMEMYQIQKIGLSLVTIRRLGYKKLFHNITGADNKLTGLTFARFNSTAIYGG